MESRIDLGARMEALTPLFPQQPGTQRGQRWDTSVWRTRPEARQLGGWFMALHLAS